MLLLGDLFFPVYFVESRSLRVTELQGRYFFRG